MLKLKERKLFDIVKFIDFMPKQKALEICMASHLLLLLLGFNKSSENILPSKLFDYFLCKKPILAIVPEGEAANLVRKSRTGHVVSNEDPNLIAKIIDNYYRDFIEKGEVDYYPDWNVIERYDSIAISKRLAEMFDEI